MSGWVCPVCGDAVAAVDLPAIRARAGDDGATCPACATPFGDVREMLVRPPAERRGPERSLLDDMEVAV